MLLAPVLKRKCNYSRQEEQVRLWFQKFRRWPVRRYDSCPKDASEHDRLELVAARVLAEWRGRLKRGKLSGFVHRKLETDPSLALAWAGLRASASAGAVSMMWEIYDGDVADASEIEDFEGRKTVTDVSGDEMVGSGVQDDVEVFGEGTREALELDTVMFEASREMVQRCMGNFGEVSSAVFVAVSSDEGFRRWASLRRAVPLLTSEERQLLRASLPVWYQCLKMDRSFRNPRPISLTWMSVESSSWHWGRAAERMRAAMEALAKSGTASEPVGV